MSLAVHFCGTTHEAGKPCPRCEGSDVATGSALPDTVDARPGEKFARLAFGAQRCTQCGRRSLPRTCFVCASVGIPANPTNSWKAPSPTGYPFPPMPVLDGPVPVVKPADLDVFEDLRRARTENDTLRLQNEQLTKDCQSIAQNCASLGALNKDLLAQLNGSPSSHSRVSDLKGDVARFTEEKADLVAAVRVKDREIERLKEAARRRR